MTSMYAASAGQKPPYFVHKHRVAYHETDAMGVVHHSNHIKYFEEARVEWLRDRGFIEIHSPYGPYTFAVVQAEARYFKPARFDEELEVRVQGRLEGARILFQYAIWSSRQNAIVADGATILVPINENMRPVKLPTAVQEAFRREPWSETWPNV